jgi:hypothetical protein
LPARDRAAAFICLTVVAILEILLQKNGRRDRCGPSRRRRAVPAVRRAYSERDGERQECAPAPAGKENDGNAGS